MRPPADVVHLPQVQDAFLLITILKSDYFQEKIARYQQFLKKSNWPQRSHFSPIPMFDVYFTICRILRTLLLAHNWPIGYLHK